MKFPHPVSLLPAICVGRFPARKAFRVVRLLGWMMIGGSQWGQADDTVEKPTVKGPSEEKLREVIEDGLGFLAREGEEWMAEKSCNSCHHVPELLWSHGEARRRGFAVDPTKFDEWLGWSLESVTAKNAGMEEIAIMILALPERPALELADRLAAAQKADGTWKPGNQFATMQKRGTTDAVIGATSLSLTALATPQAAAPSSNEALAKAGDIHPDEIQATSMESLVFRVSQARSTDQAGKSDAMIREILKHQRGDGGWSSVIGENMSDPLATGQALYALQASASDPSVAEAIARAQSWLIGTQRDDGSWPIDITHISKVDRSAPEKVKSFEEATEIYTYWGTSWATIGLLQGVPEK